MAYISVIHAVKNNNIEDLIELTGTRERVKVQCYSGSLLHAAVEKNRRDMVQVSLSHPDTEVNGRTGEGCTSLWLACDSPDGDLNIARDILDHGADPNIPNKKGVSPLHAACEGGNLELVELLIRYQADVNSQDTDGLTPLLYSAWNNWPELVEYLLAHNADVTLTKTDGSSALHIVCRNSNLQLVQLLIHHQANVNSQDVNGYTPLHCAVESGATEIVEYLLAHSANANIREVLGQNALMFALQLGQGYVDLLLPHTQNLDAVTLDGWTAVLFAILTCNVHAVRELLRHSASLTAHTCKQSALLLALTRADFALFELVWRHTNPSTVSATKDFLRLVCKYCKLPRCYKYYELILTTPGVDLHVDGASSIFYSLFENTPRAMNFYASKSQYLNVFGWLVDRGVQLETRDVQQILWRFTACSYSVELWKVVFAKTTPDICHYMVRGSVRYSNYDVALLLATYCLHLRPEDIVDFERRQDETFLRQWLALFTPASKHRHKINALRMVCWSTSARKILQDTPRFGSLQELSRDAVRRAMQALCTTTRDFLAALEKLKIPTYVKDVIRLRVPVNRHLLVDQ